MAWLERLASFLSRFTLGFALCCALVGAHDVGSFMPLNVQGYKGWTSKTSDPKDEVVLGRIIVGSSAKDWKGGDVYGDAFNTDGYQSDADWRNLERLQGEVYGANSWSPAVQAFLNMEPSVQCGDDFMTLRLKGSLLGSGLLVDGGDGSLLPLSQLPSKCGYSVKMTWPDLLFEAPYNGCYNTKEGSNYVLSLRWLGMPMKMACPHRPSTPSASVACYSSGMVVKIDAPLAVASKLNIKYKNEWKPLLWVSAQCGYSIVPHPGGLVIAAPFTPCNAKKDGMHTIEILEGKIKLSCPSPANVLYDFLFGKPKTLVPTTAAPWPPGFKYRQSPKSVPSIAVPWPLGFMYHQSPKPVPATLAPKSALVYHMPESRTGDALPSLNYPIPPWSVYPQTIPQVSFLNPGPQPFAPPYIPRPSSTHLAYTWPSVHKKLFQPAAVTQTQAGYPYGSNCGPFSHDWHRQLHLTSGSNLAEYASTFAPGGKLRHAPLPYARQCNLPYTWSSSWPAIQPAVPALPPRASREAVKSYWGLVPLSSSQ